MTISVASLVPPNPSAGLPLTLWIGKRDDDDIDLDNCILMPRQWGRKGERLEEGKGEKKEVQEKRGIERGREKRREWMGGEKRKYNGRRMKRERGRGR